MCKFCKEAKKNKLFNFCPICGENIREGFTPNYIQKTTSATITDRNGKVVDKSLPTTTLISINNKFE